MRLIAVRANEYIIFPEATTCFKNCDIFTKIFQYSYQHEYTNYNCETEHITGQELNNVTDNCRN